MDGDEKVGLGLVRNAHAVSEPRETVVLAGVDDLDLGQVLFDVLADAERDVEGDVLLCGAVAPRAKVAWVFAPVSSVQNHSESGRGRCKGRIKGHQGNAPCNHALFGYFWTLLHASTQTYLIPCRRAMQRVWIVLFCVLISPLALGRTTRSITAPTTSISGGQHSGAPHGKRRGEERFHDLDCAPHRVEVGRRRSVCLRDARQLGCVGRSACL